VQIPNPKLQIPNYQLQKLAKAGGGEVETVALVGGEVSVFERAEAGQVEGEPVFARLGGVEEAAGGDGVEGGKKRLEIRGWRLEVGGWRLGISNW